MLLRSRIMVASGIVLVGFLGIALVIAKEVRDIQDDSDQLISILDPAGEQSQLLVLTEARASAYLTEYALLGEPALMTQFTRDIESTETTIKELTALTQGIPDLLAPLIQADQARQVWILTDVEPTLAAIDRGDRQTAAVLTTSPEAERTYVEMIDASSNVIAAIDRSRAQLIQQQTRLVDVLRLSLALAAILILLVAIAVLWATQAWVLAPLTRFTADLNKVIGNRFHQLNSYGPPELRTVMNDAEHMRRALVASEDSAEAAWIGLEQQAPLATALAQHFPRTRSKIINGIEVCGDTHSLEGVVAGDWWDVFPCSAGGVGFVVGDVAGHGDRAAIVAVQMQAVLRGAITSGASPAAALHLASCAVPPGPTFFTAIVGVIHKDHPTLTVANAGHPSAIHLHGTGLHPFTPSGPLVSALGGTWQDTTRTWHPGDRLMCITDGLAACEREVGIAHVLLNQPDDSTVVDQVSAAMAALRSTTPAWSQDDVTMVLLRQTER